MPARVGWIEPRCPDDEAEKPIASDPNACFFLAVFDTEVRTQSSENQDLPLLMGLVKVGKITPVIDKMHLLSDTADAMRYLEAGYVRGKVVISVGE